MLRLACAVGMLYNAGLTPWTHDTTALESSAALIAQWQPTLLPYADRLHGHGSFVSTQKLAQAVGWQHQTSWRAQ